MRNVFFCLFLFCATLAKAQIDDLSFVNHTQPGMFIYSVAADQKELQKAYKHTSYWRKYKVLKGCAWGAFGVGICGMGAGFLALVAAITGSNSDVTRGEAILVQTALFGGACLTVSSIPLMIFAYKNRRKAKRTVQLSLNISHIYMSLPNIKQQTKPALGICINF